MDQNENSSCQSIANGDECFLSYGRYLRQKYGEPTYRIGVDGGFSCPNRGCDRKTGGCSFCDEFGSQAAYQRDWSDTGILSLDERLDSVKKQISAGTVFLKKRYAAKSFILYYQAFSSTFGRVSDLQRIYDAGLKTMDFRELVVSTRPDCVNRETAALLGGYRNDGFDVWVELGLQSAADATLERIGRGHTVEQFDNAVGLLREHGIRVAAHVIFGLPGEGMTEILNTIEHVAAHSIDGIKIHDLHLPRNSRLLREYLLGEIALPAPGRHLEYTIAALERLPSDTVVMRLTCDTPVHSRALPINPIRKGVFINLVRNEMAKRGTYQGRLYTISRTKP